jgi:hypothetical protein
MPVTFPAVSKIGTVMQPSKCSRPSILRTPSVLIPSKMSASLGSTLSSEPLLYLREAAGLSVRELARQIGESNTNVSYWESSGQIPRSDVLAPLAKVLGVSVEELLGKIHEPNAWRSNAGCNRSLKTPPSCHAAIRQKSPSSSARSSSSTPTATSEKMRSI